MTFAHLIGRAHVVHTLLLGFAFGIARAGRSRTDWGCPYRPGVERSTQLERSKRP